MQDNSRSCCAVHPSMPYWMWSARAFCSFWGPQAWGQVEDQRQAECLLKDQVTGLMTIGYVPLRASVPMCALLLSHVQLFVTPWTVAHQAPLSVDFPGKNTGVGCHFLLHLPVPSSWPKESHMNLLHWQSDSLPPSPLRSPIRARGCCFIKHSILRTNIWERYCYPYISEEEREAQRSQALCWGSHNKQSELNPRALRIQSLSAVFYSASQVFREGESFLGMGKPTHEMLINTELSVKHAKYSHLCPSRLCPQVCWPICLHVARVWLPAWEFLLIQRFRHEWFKIQALSFAEPVEWFLLC